MGSEAEGFKYIVRISDTDLDGNKTIVYGLCGVKGIGIRVAEVIARLVGVPRNTKLGELSDEKIEEIQGLINSLGNKAPAWLLNRRKDWDTGVDKHLVSTDVIMQRNEDINLLKKIRCYRGIRHELGQKVRGQRTRSNGRTGLALGVSRKRK
ncbi:MAG: 30S ribosomal protein S13 [Thermoplasmata archaeon]|nr:MAG: 30S ribosomal protein S13 [Thermoplasmata archaeon]